MAFFFYFSNKRKFSVKVTEIPTKIVLCLKHLQAISYYVNLAIAIYSIDWRILLV